MIMEIISPLKLDSDPTKAVGAFPSVSTALCQAAGGSAC